MTPHDRREFLALGAAGFAAAFLEPDPALLFPRMSAETPLDVAVIGAGRQGRAILGELATIEGARVVAVCDVDEARRGAAEKRASGAKAYASHAELLSKEASVAAVVVATPTHLHRAIVLDALAAGKHVFCEAPLAHTLEDLAALSAAARSAKTVVAAGFQGRANPIYLLARSFHKAGALRELATLHAQNHKKTSWRTPGSSPEREKELNWHLDPTLSLGLEGEFGAHQLDVFHWFTGRHPVFVRGSGALRLHKDGRAMPDTVRVETTFEDGLAATWSGTLANSLRGRREILAGEMAAFDLAWTHGWMFKEADAPTAGWEVYANRQPFHTEQGITLIADATKLAAQGKLQEGVGLPFTSLYYSLADFVKAASSGGKPACSFSDGARSTAVAILAHAAVATGKEQAIDPKLLEAL
ncbi:MAG: Gfo/Idh/MocA family oxidoreductase [Planctomycetes bacterium]|nr:Gfo/Idh/MocA family oxidoreductase [Planctomycetota bacterium]